MKKLRSGLLITLVFAIFANIYPGFKFQDYTTLLAVSIIFASYQVFARPLLKILTLPMNILTLGFFSLILSVIIFYLLSFLVPGFSIVGFETPSLTVLGWEVTTFNLSPLFAAIIASVTLSAFLGLLLSILA